MEQHYRPVEIARLLGVSKSHIYNLVKLGRIPSFRLSRRIVVPASAVQALRDPAQ